MPDDLRTRLKVGDRVMMKLGTFPQQVTRVAAATVWAADTRPIFRNLVTRYKAEELATGPLTAEAVAAITAAAEAYLEELKREEVAHRERRLALRARFEQIVAAAAGGAA